MEDLKIVYLPPGELTPYERNAKKHDRADIDAIKASINELGGFNDPIGIWGEKNIIVEGHGRQIAAIELGLDVVPCIRLDHLTDEQRRAYAVAHNKTQEIAQYDWAVLEAEVSELELDFPMADFGFDMELLHSTKYKDDSKNAGILEDIFILPPVSVLDARKGKWVSRKREWKNRIGDSGRRGSSKLYKSAIFRAKTPDKLTSILDPALCELMLRWFTPGPGTNVFDCFAGDPSMGYVAAAQNYVYTGIELREEQCEDNRWCVEKDTLDGTAMWICDDGRNVASHIAPESQDLFFSCPPYYNLEVYSDLENDASNQGTYEEFYQILDDAFVDSIKCLKENRFAIVVCGDVRGNNGGYYDFPGDIKRTFTREGLLLYNEMILVDPFGSASIRAGNAMRNRKVIKVHQNVLVFFKGKQDNIKKHFPDLRQEYDALKAEAEEQEGDYEGADS